jgi:PAB-dependent poly(A)-specific ribonuclease subunit 2
MVQTLAISPSCQCFAVGTSDGYVHLSITNDGAVFHTHPEETEFGTYPYPTPVPPMSYNDFLASLASIPFPIPMRTYEDEYNTQPRPLSAWPGTTANKVYRRAPPIDPEIVKSMKIVQSIGYFPNTGSNYRARQIPYKIR